MKTHKKLVLAKETIRNLKIKTDTRARAASVWSLNYGGCLSRAC